ncbi:MAG: RES family NAD+ phosphorylase, partial [Candidatus Limnocylindria bacterium]
ASPFLWETADQPAARWHGAGEGPAHYLADTPDGAWAEFLRHEHITDPEDLAGISETVWAIEVPDDLRLASPALASATVTGDQRTYPDCRAEGRRIRAAGADGLRTVSAALLPAGATGWRVDGGLRAGTPRDGQVVVLYRRGHELAGWRACAEGRPGTHLLNRVRYLR